MAQNNGLKTLDFELSENQRRFIAAVIRNPGTTRVALSEMLGFSAQTAMRTVGPLVEAGILVEIDQVTGTRGKPPRLVNFSKNSLISVGIIIAPERVTVSFADLQGTMITRETQREKFEGCAQQLAAVSGIFTRLVEELPNTVRLVSAAVTASGFSLEKGKRVVSRVDPEGWSATDLHARIRDLTGVPTTIQNDTRVVAASLLEQTEFRDFLCILLDVGIGGAIVTEGKLLEGATGNAGAFGRLFPHYEERPSEISLREALGLQSWDTWNRSALSQDQENALEAWLASGAEKMSHALSMSLALLDFEHVVVCSRMPEEILQRLVNRISITPLGANLVTHDGMDTSFVLPVPDLHVHEVNNLAGMAHILATRAFLETDTQPASGAENPRARQGR